MITATVYVIFHLESRLSIYYGKTIRFPRRCRDHRRSARADQTPLYTWWRSLSSDPTIAILEQRTFETRAAADAWSLTRESELVAAARARGFYVLNANDAGRGGRNPLPCTRARMQASARRRTRKRFDGMTPSEIQAFNRWVASCRTTESFRAARGAQLASTTPEQRSESARKANAGQSPEERSDRARKAWATKRARGYQHRPKPKHDPDQR